MKKFLVCLLSTLPIWGMDSEHEVDKNKLVIAQLLVCLKNTIENSQRDQQLIVPLIEKLIYNPYFNKTETFLAFFKGAEQIAHLKFTCKVKRGVYSVLFVDLICVKKGYQDSGIGSVMLNALQCFALQLAQKHKLPLVFYLKSAALTNPQPWCNFKYITGGTRSAQNKRAHFYTKNGLTRAHKTPESFGEWVLSLLTSCFFEEEQLFGAIFNGSANPPQLKKTYAQYQFPLKKITTPTPTYSTLFKQLELFFDPLFSEQQGKELYPDIRIHYIYHKKSETSRPQKIEIGLIAKKQNQKIELINALKKRPKSPWKSFINTTSKENIELQKKFNDILFTKASQQKFDK